MPAESNTFSEEVRVFKWSEEQTRRAAEHHGIDPAEVTHDHFMTAGLIPDEEIRIDHAQGRVIQIDAVGNRRVVSIDAWNQEEH